MSICLRLCFALFVACVVVAFVAFALFVALFVFRIVVSHCLSHYCVCSHCLWHRLCFAFACVCVSHCCVALFVVFFVQFWCFMHVHRLLIITVFVFSSCIKAFSQVYQGICFTNLVFVTNLVLLFNQVSQCSPHQAMKSLSDSVSSQWPTETQSTPVVNHCCPQDQ